MTRRRHGELRRNSKRPAKAGKRPETVAPVGLRIVAGRFRGRKLAYSGDRRVRPMKQRVRESLFSILGGSLEGFQAVDLFAGTGALALESLSRGAKRAVLVELHRPTAACLQKNITALGVEAETRLIVGDAFKRQDVWSYLDEGPWVVFCCPPYELFHSRRNEMIQLIEGIIKRLPAESALVVESDVTFPASALPQAEKWDVRRYPPAQLAFYFTDSEIESVTGS